MMTTPNEKSPAPELASEAADSGAHPARESIVDARAAAGNETSSKVRGEDALTGFAEYRRGLMEAFHFVNMANANRQGRTAEETCAHVVAMLARLANGEQPAAAPIDGQRVCGCTGRCLDQIGCPEKAWKPTPSPADERAAFSLNPLQLRWIADHIRDAYEAGYRDARSNRAIPDDNFPGYRGLEIERSQSKSLVSLVTRAASASETGAEGATERDLSRTIGERDQMEEIGTRLADAVGEFLGVDVGEWSSANNPILVAIEALESSSPAMAAEAVAYTHPDRLKRLADGKVQCETLWSKALVDDGDISLYVAPQPEQADARDDTHKFKNFHRLLCERFGYVHDEIDWRRDQVSLIEWIAKKADAREGLTDELRYVLSESLAYIDNLPDGPSDHLRHDSLKAKLRAILATHPGQPEPSAEVTEAARDVLAERRRQIEQEGWTPAHDDAHSTGDMALAAACYAVADNENYPLAEPPDLWPWDYDWWKPTDERRNLVKAGALIVAEIERIDRAAARAGDAA